MTSTRRCVGQWWLPDQPDRRVGGVLDIDLDTGLRLELTDRLVGDGHRPEMAPILHGHADGRQVTLLECQPANGGTMTLAQVITTTQVFRTGVALIGVHLSDESDAVFNGLDTAVTGLTPWAAQSSIAAQIIYEPDTGDRYQRVDVRRVPPVEVSVTEPAPMTMNLRWHAVTNGPNSDLRSRVYRVEEQVLLRLQAPQPLPWDAFNPFTTAVQDLMTVATQTPCRVTSQELLIGTDDRPYKVDLYFRRSDGPAKREDRFNESDMVFTLADVDFTTVIPRWFALRERLGLPLAVLLGMDYQPDGYHENRLFNAAAAAEGFHAALFPEATSWPSDVHAAIKKRVSRALTGLRKGLLSKVTGLLDQLPNHEQEIVVPLVTPLSEARQREWVMTRLGDNRPGLKERLLQLATKADRTAVHGLLTDVDIWAQWLRNARNAIGHLNTGVLEASIPDEDALYRLDDITRALLHLVILAELGLSADTQRRLVNDEWGYSAARFGDAVHRHKTSNRAPEATEDDG